jgi:GDPmannose 4,6-dehydratase
MEQKIALIFGITGQDGSYLSELLLEKGYIVHGVIRRSSQINTHRLDHIYKLLKLHYGDLSDSGCINKLINQIKPDEIYNLAAMSHVKVSFDVPEYTCDIDALGTLRILESIKSVSDVKKIKFYQAGTSELYGGIYDTKQNEKTPFNPRSPYATAKLFSYWITKNYRESYNIFAVNGVLFNHTSPRRGETFVEQKIVKAVVAIQNKKQDCLYLGNIYSYRDYGHAKDFTNAMYLMLQQDNPDDYVIATGEKYMIKDIVTLVFAKMNLKIEWSGKDVNEIATVVQSENAKMIGKVVVRIDPKYFRPLEVESLVGDASLAISKLNWKAEYTFDDIINEMIIEELKNN